MVGVPGDLFAWIGGLVAAAIGWVIRVVYMRTTSHLDSLEERMQAVEKSSMQEHKVRQLILDAVVPIKDSQEEIKHDLNRILDILLRRQTRGGEQTSRSD